MYGAALLLWIGSRFLDGIDGTMARLSNRQTELGGYLDLVLDVVIYALFPIAAAAAHMQAGYGAAGSGIASDIAGGNIFIALSLLLAAYYINLTCWAVLAAILEKRSATYGTSGGRAKLTTVIMPRGIVEGFETVVVYALFCIVPQFLWQLFIITAILTLLSAAMRVAWAIRHRRALEEKTMSADENRELALLGGGCFWCLEACYLRVEGITKVVSGYAGGSADTANYSDVCSGGTGHAEVVQVEFDTKRIDYATILEYFWQVHDPTQLNRQGADVGKQYRSVIYYHSEEQRKIAEQSIAEQGEKHTNKIFTALQSAPQFYPAENYHQQYYDQHPGAPYCTAIIRPKLHKMKIE